MSILIKGMKMPTEGKPVVVELWNNGKAYVYGTKNSEMHEAVELPDHGDLVDRDALMSHKGSAYDIDGHELYAVGTGTILRMPVIIPTERSEE